MYSIRSGVSDLVVCHTVILSYYIHTTRVLRVCHSRDQRCHTVLCLVQVPQDTGDVAQDTGHTKNAILRGKCMCKSFPEFSTRLGNDLRTSLKSNNPYSVVISQYKRPSLVLPQASQANNTPKACAADLTCRRPLSIDCCIVLFSKRPSHSAALLRRPRCIRVFSIAQAKMTESSL